MGFYEGVNTTALEVAIIPGSPLRMPSFEKCFCHAEVLGHSGNLKGVDITE
jgi:hypothetical protein